MSYEDGWAALQLQTPRRIPRTEYSATMHWELVRAVTGIEVGVDSSPQAQREAALGFERAWDYSFHWSTLIGHDELGAYQSDMGHAEYAAGGVDRRDTVYNLYDDPEDILRFDPWEALGRKDQRELVRRFEAHYRASCAARPDGVNMTGTYITLISGLIALFGWDMLLLAAGTDQVRFGDLTNRYAAWMQQYYDALAESDVPVVMTHDDMVWSSGPIFRPAWYREYVFPNYRRLWAPLREAGKRIMFTSDGDYTTFIDDLAAAGLHGFVLEPLTSMEAIVERYGQTHVIVGNADTRILLNGTRDAIRAEVTRCMSLGRDCPGFIMAVGNHIPPNTPVESALYYNEVYLEQRDRW
ncbi:MAG: hypothetical protein JXA09_15080 [Anaerolineae bacterium]|nr:hypothetical protein [Anaerolineae bacterium]